MKRDTFIQMVIFKQIFHFCIFRRNFNCHTSPTSMPNFCIGFWNDIGDKKSEKNHFRVLPISRENYPCRPVFEGFELNRKTSPPFLNEQNRELWMFSGRGFKNFEKKCKNKKKCLKMTTGKAMKMKIGLKMRLKWAYLSQKLRQAPKVSVI